MMRPDMSAYRAVTNKLRVAEQDAVLRRLEAGAEPGVPIPRAAEEGALLWVREFQMCRTYMDLMLRDLADAVFEEGELRLRIAADLPPELLERLLDPRDSGGPR